jgi:hypothetical protein
MSTGTNSLGGGAVAGFRRQRLGRLVREANHMHSEREARKSMLRAQIAQGDYRVDPHAIADAILRRVRMVETDEERPGQKVCSYPASVPSTSPKTTPGGPSMTHPTQVRPTLSVAPSASLRAVGGMHTQSS